MNLWIARFLCGISEQILIFGLVHDLRYQLVVVIEVKSLCQFPLNEKLVDEISELTTWYLVHPLTINLFGTLQCATYLDSTISLSRTHYFDSLSGGELEFWGDVAHLDLAAVGAFK